MTAPAPPDGEPARARKVPREDARPQSVLERQQTLGTYLLHRAERRRERFLLRSKTTTIGREILRALYLTGCILIDLLVIPEAIFLLPGYLGWGVAAAGFVVAIALEGRFYARHFALHEEAADDT